MTAIIRPGLVLSGGRKRQIPSGGIAYGKGFGRLRTLGEVVFAGQSTGVHTNGNTYTYDGVDFIAYRTDANGQTEINANGLKISRTASSVSPNAHGIYAPGDATNGGWIYQKVGMSRFHLGNWQFWLRFASTNIGSMTVAFAGAECNGGYPYHGVSCRRMKSGVNTPAAQGGNQAVIYGPTTESAVNMTSSDTGYQYDTLCINAISPVLFEVMCGSYGVGYPALNTMKMVGILNHLSATHHTGAHGTTTTTFLRDLKLWQVYLMLGGTNVGDVTIERIRLTSFE